MSQVATASAVSTSCLQRLAALATAKDYRTFWFLLREEGDEVTPPYDYSGFVVAAAVSYLTEQGIVLPLDISLPAAAELVNSGMGVVAIAGAIDAKKTAEAIEKLGPEDRALAEYFEEFTGEAFDEAAAAMRQALSYITAAMILPTVEKSWCLLFVG